MTERPSLGHPDLMTATAVQHPCELYCHNAPPHPARTQGHHRYPVYLQKKLWGEVRIDDIMWVCGLCHDSIHEALGWLLGETRQPEPMPGRKAMAEARRAWEWYVNASKTT